MYEPFKEGRDYVSIIRQCLFVDHVPQGAPMYYDKDPQFAAVKIAEKGAVPIVEVYGERVTLEPFPIAVLVRIPALEVATRRFNILDREQVRASGEMAEIEDTEGFNVLEAAAEVSDALANPDLRNEIRVGSIGTNVTLDDLSFTFSQIEDHDAPVANVIMRALQYRAFRTIDTTGGVFDPVTRRELLKTGYYGNLWNSAVRISKKATKNRVLVLADPEFLGVVSVRIDLDQMEAPDPRFIHFGWVFFSYLSIAAISAVGSSYIDLQ